MDLTLYMQYLSTHGFVTIYSCDGWSLQNSAGFYKWARMAPVATSTQCRRFSNSRLVFSSLFWFGHPGRTRHILKPEEFSIEWRGPSHAACTHTHSLTPSFFGLLRCFYKLRSYPKYPWESSVWVSMGECSVSVCNFGFPKILVNSISSLFYLCVDANLLTSWPQSLNQIFPVSNPLSF